MSTPKTVAGYLPDERPPVFELLLFALQQIIVMFPATVLVALMTGFHVSTTIFASGLATLCFILVTGRKIPLYYGSSFSYIAAISSITGVAAFSGPAPDEKIQIAQFGIVMSGLVSIIAGLIVRSSKKAYIDKVLPAAVTGSIAIIIGLSLAATAVQGATGVFDFGAEMTQVQNNFSWMIALITLFATILYSVFLKGKLSQLPILFGLLTGYLAAVIVGLTTDIQFINLNKLGTDALISIPHFTFPKASWMAVAAIMPIAIATIPESTAHIFQLDIYVNHLAKKKNSAKKYDIENRLGQNLIGDGIGDIVSGALGGPAGTNYGENISTMAITKNFSIAVLIAASIITMLISFFTPLANAVYSIPSCVIGGISIYLFGVIAAQGITIIMDKKVNMFQSKNLAVIATILIIGLGGTFYFPGGMIQMFGINFPAIATAAVVGIILNLVLSIGHKDEVDEAAIEKV